MTGVAPGIVKTPIWTEDKLLWVDEGVDKWVTTDQVASTILNLITNKEHVGGTILEVGVDSVRPVTELNDPGPQWERAHSSRARHGLWQRVHLIEQNFGK